MSRLISAIAGFVLLVAPEGALGETMQMLVNRQPRTYLIERPATRGPLPTIIMLHGLDSTGERIAQRTGLGQSAPREGFVAIFPQGLAQRWNHFPRGQEPAQFVQKFQRIGGVPDDVAFLRMLVAELVQRSISDPSRIYLAGLSNGGLLTLRTICTAPDAFAAIGLLVASMPEHTGAVCQLSKPMPVLMLSGTSDDLIPYHGGTVPNSSVSVWSTDRVISFFHRLNGCDGSVGRSVVPGLPQRIEVEYAGPCRGGPVVLYRVIGGTHRTTPDALITGQLLLDFFRDKIRSASSDLPAQRATRSEYTPK
jgi:polyhydroxybutyrate depolymerase